MSASCFAPWCGIDGKYANPGVCNAPGGHRYREPEPEVVPDPLPTATLLRDQAARVNIWYEVAHERIRAHDKHGDTSMESQAAESLDRLFILVEEVAEVAELFLAARHGPLDNRDHLVSLLRRIVDVGQVAHRLNDQRHDGAAPWPVLPDVDAGALRTELIQVAAMAGAWADVC